MNFFGVSPVEIVFIAVLGLIIFGPERLPEIGRFLGRSLARVLAWQHTSPEAQLLNELRRDFEQQIIEIRDEMVYARQQLDIRGELSDLQRETEALLRGETIAPKAASTHAVSTTDAVATPATPEPTIAPPATQPPPVPVPPPPAPSISARAAPVEQTSPSIDQPTRGEIEVLVQQIQVLSASVQSLQEQLRQRGLLDPEWQPQVEQQEQIA